MIWSRRELVAFTVIIVTVLGLFTSTIIDKSSSSAAKTTSTLRDDFELRSFTLEGKLLASVSGRGTPNPLLAPSTSALLTKKPTQPMSEKGQAALLTRQFILARHLGHDEIAEDRRKDLAALDSDLSNEITDLKENSGAAAVPLTEEAKDALGWTAVFIIEPPEVVRAELQKTVWGMAGLAFGIFGVAVAGITLWIYLLVTLVRGRLHTHFSAQGFHPALRLEIFALYLLIVTGSGYLLRTIPGLTGWTPDPLIFNVVLMSALPLLAILWPIINGVSLGETMRTLGLAPDGPWKTLKDLVVAPFAYSAMWVVLLPILMLYAAAIHWLEIDMASGAHPVFVWMSKPGGEGPSFILLFILASVVAPILEEIMFRGSLYSWLRLRLGVALSLFTSGLLFAAIHPQGLLGLLPLTACAVTFGMLREWRGTLWSSMIAHALVNGVSLGIFSVFMAAT